ncbi:hypothetical protein ACFLSF_04780, partial [Candidatus Bipolaricaulota bacterium]
GVGAFFFFSWIIQLLWNSILVDQLALVPVKLSYWQAAALWFLVTLLFAWTGIARRPRSLAPRIRWTQCGDVARAVKREIRSHVRDWVREEHDQPDPSDLGDRIEAKIKRGFSKWVGVDESVDIEWDDLGEHIERRIKDKFRDWVDE